MSPYGSVVPAEDGSGAQHLLSWTQTTGTQAIARHFFVLEQTEAGVDVYSEMTGPCFSSDGRSLFGNVQVRARPSRSRSVEGLPRLTPGHEQGEPTGDVSRREPHTVSRRQSAGSTAS